MKVQLRPDGKKEVFDPIRKKYVLLTPEEGVRQFVIAFLQSQCGVPAGHIAVETGLKLYDRPFRTDLRISNRQGKSVMVIECKRPTVALTQDVMEQAMRYNMLQKERFVLITNGKGFLCWERPQKETEHWREWGRYPDWAELNRETDQPSG